MTRPMTMNETERLRTSEVAEILRVTPRAVQCMALRGDLPGAAQIGKLWTFDARRLRMFIAQREAECASATFISAEESGG